jgi:hypothetical protein
MMLLKAIDGPDNMGAWCVVDRHSFTSDDVPACACNKFHFHLEVNTSGNCAAQHHTVLGRCTFCVGAGALHAAACFALAQLYSTTKIW